MVEFKNSLRVSDVFIGTFKQFDITIRAFFILSYNVECLFTYLFQSLTASFHSNVNFWMNSMWPAYSIKCLVLCYNNYLVRTVGVPLKIVTTCTQTLGTGLHFRAENNGCSTDNVRSN